MNLEIIESVIDLIEMGAVRSEDVVKNLRSAIKDTLEQSSTQPQTQERPVDCERCNRLEEHAYDLIGKLRVANIKLSMQPQRTWVDLTDEEIQVVAKQARSKDHAVTLTNKLLREKNNGV